MSLFECFPASRAILPSLTTRRLIIDPGKILFGEDGGRRVEDGGRRVEDGGRRAEDGEICRVAIAHRPDVRCGRWVDGIGHFCPAVVSSLGVGSCQVAIAISLAIPCFRFRFCLSVSHQ